MSTNTAEDLSVVTGGHEIGTSSRGGTPQYIVGWRLHLISLGLLLSLFMSQMESSIVSTAIVNITNDLGGYGKSSWVFTAYLLTYSGMLIIWAKMSDIFGRKPVLLVALLLFIAFSGACGASQKFLDLIMFRWVLGLGGSGIYSIATLLFFELVPPPKYADYTALVAAVIALSLISGPLLGGVINAHSNWRWVFLLNVPIGSAALILLVMIMPKRLQTEPSASGATIPCWHGFAPGTLKRIDFLGAFLLLGACLLVVTALEQAAAGTSFADRDILPLLIISGLNWTAFVIWQWYATTKLASPEPVLPWRLLTNRVFLGMILNSYFAGTILTVCIVQLPQRFITVNGESVFQAGVKLLPFGAFIPAGSTLAATLMGRGKIRAEYILVAGGILEVVGTILLSKTSAGLQITHAHYGYQILTGTGVGFLNAALILLVPHVLETRDLAVGTAAIAQFRLLGGVIGLAIVTSALNRSMKPKLLQLLLPDQVDALLESINVLGTFSEETQLAVRRALGEGYALQMKVLIGFAVAQLPATLLMWNKKPTIVS